MQTFEQLGLGKIVKKKGTYYTKVGFERTNMSKLTDTQMVTKTLNDFGINFHEYSAFMCRIIF